MVTKKKNSSPSRRRTKKFVVRELSVDETKFLNFVHLLPSATDILKSRTFQWTPYKCRKITKALIDEGFVERRSATMANEVFGERRSARWLSLTKKGCRALGIVKPEKDPGTELFLQRYAEAQAESLLLLDSAREQVRELHEMK